MPQHAFVPGVHQMTDEEKQGGLEYDSSAYTVFHRLAVDGWPCLSFDIMRDTLGEQRNKEKTAIHQKHCKLVTDARTYRVDTIQT